MMRMGLLGATSARTRQILRILAARPDVDIVGVSDSVPVRAQALSAEFGITPFPEAGEILTQGVDAVIIGAELAARPALIRLAAGMTPYVLCDIPLSPTLEETTAALAACETHGTTVQPALYLRYAPVMHTLKRVLDEGRLGQVLSVKIIYHGKRSMDLPESETAGASAIFYRGPHIVDLLCWLLDTEITEVYAQAGAALLGGNPGIEDAGMLSLNLANGAYATADVSWALPEAYPAPENLKLEIIGDAGSIRVDAFRQNVDLHTTSTRWVNWGTDPLAEMLRQFLDAVTARRSPELDREVALRAQVIVMAARQSSTRGTPVKLRQ